ncbi:MAG: TraB/GumN family protein [Akkermansiaceae bacterium]
MLKRNVVIFSHAIFLSLGCLSFSSAKEMAEKPAQLQAQALTQAQALKKASKIANEDLSDLKHPKKPMLWSVEGNGLKKSSYLFGSIHVSDENITTLHPDAETAYKQADTLATEIDMGIINQLRATKMMMRDDNKSLVESIGLELYNELDAQLKEVHPSLSAAPFSNMKTWAVMLIHAMVEEQMKGGTALDLQLWERASNDEKKRWALETMKEQLGTFDQLTEDDQNTLLKDSLFAAKILKKEKINSMSLIKNLYLKGDADQLVSLMTLLGTIEGTNQKVAEKFGKLLLNKRNDRMTANILKTFKESPDQSHFIVAGALHYLGEHTIVDLLRKQGYTVTRK